MGQVEFKSNRFVFWCRTGEWVFTTKWRIYQGIWERNILTVGTLKAFFTSCFPFHCAGATGQVWPEAALQIGTCLCALDLKEVVRKGGQRNLISLRLFLQSFAKWAFLRKGALMPGVWEWGVPPGSGRWSLQGDAWAGAGLWKDAGPRRARETQTSSPPLCLTLYCNCRIAWDIHS